jgi:hypothetical protein
LPSPVFDNAHHFPFRLLNRIRCGPRFGNSDFWLLNGQRGTWRRYSETEKSRNRRRVVINGLCCCAAHASGRRVVQWWPMVANGGDDVEGIKRDAARRKRLIPSL